MREGKEREKKKNPPQNPKSQSKTAPEQLYKTNSPTQNILKIISVRAIETQTSKVPEGRE